MVYCAKCGSARDLPMSAVRSSRAPCQFCGSYDKLQVKSRHGVETRDLANYSYPDRLIEGTASDVNTQAEREYEGAS